jgi:hypothetical protein
LTGPAVDGTGSPLDSLRSWQLLSSCVSSLAASSFKFNACIFIKISAFLLLSFRLVVDGEHLENNVNEMTQKNKKIEAKPKAKANQQ